MNHSDRIPPQNLDAERSVLGCQLLGEHNHESRARIEQLPQAISASDFFSDVHSKIQKAIWDASDRNGGDVDVLIVSDQLQSTGDLDDIGGTAYLHEVMASVEHTGNVLHYAGLVVGASRRRKAIDIGQRMIEQAYDPTKSDEALIQDAHDSAMRMAEILHVKKSRPRPISEHVSERIAMLRRGESPVMFNGIPDIDDAIGGFALGELVVMGARPSHGKSAIALQWLDHASRQNVSSLMISEEMTASELATRTISYLTMIPKEEWLGDLDLIERHATEHFSTRARVLVAENVSKISTAERAIARAVKSHGIQIVAVDYAQLIDGDGDTKEQRVGNVSKRLKQAAMKHVILILLLAQLNREVDKRDKLTPQISDLKDSGSLEADADVVLLPYSPWMFDNTYRPRAEYRIICAKNRNRAGRGKIIEMRSDFSRQRIMSIEDYSRSGLGENEGSGDVDRFFK